MKTLLIVILLALPMGLMAQKIDAEKEEWKASFRKSDEIPQGIVVANKEKKEPKFNTSIGLGNGYKVGDRVLGRYHFDNSPALSIRLGYSPYKYIEFQGEYFNAKNFYRNRPLLPLEQHQRYYNYGLNLKFKAPIIIKGVAFSPYFIFGTGKAMEIYEGVGAGVKFKYSGSGKYRKTGGGIEVGLKKNLFIFSEYAYYKIGLIVLDVGPYQIKDRMYYSTVIGGIGLRI